MRKFLPYFSILLVLSLAVFLLLFRPAPVTFSEVTVPGKFRISVPAFLSKTDSINADALLQYKNEKKEMFLLVFEEGTAGRPLDAVFKDFSGGFLSGMQHGSLVKYYPYKIDGRNALIGNIRGTVNETAVYYRLAVIESGNSYYKVALGVSDDNQLFYDEEMTACIQSIRFLPLPE